MTSCCAKCNDLPTPYLQSCNLQSQSSDYLTAHVAVGCEVLLLSRPQLWLCYTKGSAEAAVQRCPLRTCGNFLSSSPILRMMYRSTVTVSWMGGGNTGAAAHQAQGQYRVGQINRHVLVDAQWLANLGWVETCGVHVHFSDKGELSMYCCTQMQACCMCAYASPCTLTGAFVCM